MKTITKRLVFSISSIILVVILMITCTFSWFVITKKSTGIQISGDCNISVQGYILKYNQISDGSGKDVFISDKGTYPLDINKTESITGDSNSLQGLDIKNYLKFIFVISNNDAENDCKLSFKLGAFANKIFAFYDDYANEYAQIKADDSEDLFSKKDDVTTLAKQYNAKFSLYFDKFQYCIGDDYINDVDKDFSNGTKKTDITLDQTNPFLWKYSTGNKVLDNEIQIAVGQTITLSFLIKTQQNSESINDYKNWMVTQYGRKYLAINKFNDSSYEQLTEEDKSVIDGYINYFVNAEINTIYSEDNKVLQETKLLIDYMEFIGETV